MISFVIPCYRSAKTIGSVVAEIEKACEDIPKTADGYEIILVNDGSGDDTWETIKGLAESDLRVTAIDLARNFGQHGALMAGLSRTKGDVVICLDDDGQTPADEAYKLIAAIENGADVAYARYANKQHSAFRNFGSWVNEVMAGVMLGKPASLTVSSYFAAKRFVIDEVLKYEGAYPYLIGLVLRASDRIVNVDVTHRKREVGVSGYTFGKLVSLWMNGFTAFSIKPLRIATLSGTLFAMVGFLYGIYTIIKKFVIPDIPVGFSALMSAIMFIGGMVMLMLGLIGEYLGRLYITQNNSPQYIVRDIVK
ncbi:MAG: glycosyltransferase family 2 protein [Lachnospiraceae bacterium]|nr:glycosyltransferase family 2 protein [Lachnospiraceae bacterium]